MAASPPSTAAAASPPRGTERSPVLPSRVPNVVRAGVLFDLAGAWRTIGRDPIGVLLPAAGVLLLRVATLGGLERWFLGEIAASVPAVVAAVFLASVAASLIRARMLSASAHALGLPGRPRGLALAVVDVLVLVLELVAAAIPVVPLLSFAVFLVSRGLHLFGALAIGAGLVLGSLMILIVRAVFAYAPYEVIVRGQGPLAAMGASATMKDTVVLLVLVLAGDVALALGGALCGAGALPGYPLGDVAVMRRASTRGAVRA